ncbi:hypothetical protein H9P43_008923 [Blastocladiella emersonii ATCC 22665]|nr:hypothetical protein H9P43_008923 [Blastocladiella emersonii ATCC 22665]
MPAIGSVKGEDSVLGWLIWVAVALASVFVLWLITFIWRRLRGASSMTVVPTDDTDVSAGKLAEGKSGGGDNAVQPLKTAALRGNSKHGHDATDDKASNVLWTDGKPIFNMPTAHGQHGMNWSAGSGSSRGSGTAAVGYIGSVGVLGAVTAAIVNAADNATEVGGGDADGGNDSGGGGGGLDVFGFGDVGGFDGNIIDD